MQVKLPFGRESQASALHACDRRIRLSYGKSQSPSVLLQAFISVKHTRKETNARFASARTLRNDRTRIIAPKEKDCGTATRNIIGAWCICFQSVGTYMA